MTQMYAQPAPPRRRRARWPWVLLVIVLVLGGLFVAADRIALSWAEDKVATSLQQSQHLSSKPDVDVAGFPFLTQLAAGEFDDVTVTADDVEVGHGLTISPLVVDLHHVTVSDDRSEVRARTAQAAATIGYTDLSRVLHTTISDGGDGRLVAEPSVTIAGHTFHGKVSAVPHASSGDEISFGDPKVSVNGVDVPSEVRNALAGVFSTAISLAGIPFHIRVTGGDVTNKGVIVHLTGRDLVYRR